MNRISLQRAALPGIAALALTVAMTSCGASNETTSTTSSGGGDLSGTLNGAGSTAQESAMTAWKAGFQSANSGVTVNYDAVGSGSGVEQFLSGGVQFAGSDAYLSDDELKKVPSSCGKPVEVPVYVSPIAVIYNLPGVDNLQLSPATLAQIFAGKITTWDDPAIAADNPDAQLPSTAITPVHRSDSSGTTANFTDYLSQVASSDWTFGSIEDWPKSVSGGEGANGTSGVVAAVTNGEGAVGYADASQAGDLGTASIKVGSSYEQPTADAAAKVLDESKPAPGRGGTDLAIAVNRTTTSSGVYPIVLVSYQILCSTYSDSATADLVKGFEQYVVSSDGQDAAAKQAGSAPITDALRSKAQTAIDSIAGQ
ncbi:MAG: phosphate ABC transporter substrate-binding protein PstS [Nocardioidaceae bacterium]